MTHVSCETGYKRPLGKLLVRHVAGYKHLLNLQHVNNATASLACATLRRVQQPFRMRPSLFGDEISAFSEIFGLSVIQRPTLSMVRFISGNPELLLP